MRRNDEDDWHWRLVDSYFRFCKWMLGSLIAGCLVALAGDVLSKVTHP